MTLTVATVTAVSSPPLSEALIPSRAPGAAGAVVVAIAAEEALVHDPRVVGVPAQAPVVWFQAAPTQAVRVRLMLPSDSVDVSAAP